MKRTERGFFLQKRDNLPLIYLADITAAIGLLTRLPVKVDSELATERGASSAWAYPLVGILVAFLTTLAAAILLGFGISAPIAAALALVVQVIITGAMHEDGLSDTADGLWGGWTKERRLEIMKDSRIGAYGVIALVLSLLVRWLALSTIIAHIGFFWPLIAIAALSRANMVVLMGALPHARDGGLSKSVGRPDINTVIIGGFIALLILLICVSRHAPLMLLLTALAALACAAIARRKINGQTGDILGATQQVTEITLLVALASILT